MPSRETEPEQPDKHARRIFYQRLMGERPPAEPGVELAVLTAILDTSACAAWGCKYLVLADFHVQDHAEWFGRLRGSWLASPDLLKPDTTTDAKLVEFKQKCKRLRMLNVRRTQRRLAWRLVKAAYSPHLTGQDWCGMLRNLGDKLFGRIEQSDLPDKIDDWRE